MSVPGARRKALPVITHHAMTIMFCQLCPMCNALERTDLEALRLLVHTYQAVGTELIHQHNGFVARRTGQELLAYFGYPNARDDHAWHGLVAASELLHHPWIRQIADTSTDALRFDVQIGIASGPVVVARRVSEVGGADHEVIGGVANLAARLRALAAPGSALVSANTQALLGEPPDELTALGSHNVKGFPAPIDAWQLKR